jgi:hypothetical protein
MLNKQTKVQASQSSQKTIFLLGKICRLKECKFIISYFFVILWHYGSQVAMLTLDHQQIGKTQTTPIITVTHMHEQKPSEEAFLLKMLEYKAPTFSCTNNTSKM